MLDSFFLSVGARVIHDGLRQGMAEMSIHILVGERVGYRPNNRFVGFPVQPRAYTSRSVRQESASDTSQHWNGVVSGVPGHQPKDWRRPRFMTRVGIDAGSDVSTRWKGSSRLPQQHPIVQKFVRD